MRVCVCAYVCMCSPIKITHIERTSWVRSENLSPLHGYARRHGHHAPLAVSLLSPAENFKNLSTKASLRTRGMNIESCVTRYREIADLILFPRTCIKVTGTCTRTVPGLYQDGLLIKGVSGGKSGEERCLRRVMGVDDVTDLDHKGNLEGRLDLCAMSHCTSKPSAFQSRGSTPSSPQSGFPQRK